MATPLEASLVHAVAALKGVADVALIGGLAVSTRAEPRLTRDGDLAVAVADDAEAERVVFELGAHGYRVTALVEHVTQGRLATARLVSPLADHILIDLLFASSGIEPEVVGAATPAFVTPRLEMPVASVGHLIAMKLLSVDIDRRPGDRADLNALADVATADDWAVAADAVALIEARGYHRDRDLVAALARLRDEVVSDTS